MPDFVPPSLATLRTAAPSGVGWVHEIKFDGYRIQARLDHGGVRLLTRKGLDWTSKFPNVAAAVAKLPAALASEASDQRGDSIMRAHSASEDARERADDTRPEPGSSARADTALIDGEIVVEDERGVSVFSMLQAALKEGRRDAFVYYVFDLLHLDGRDLRELPLAERKAELERLLDRAKGVGNAIRYSEHFDEDGALVLQQACRMTLEGIVSKRADAPYRSGRGETFIKTKCSNAQEFVVGGYSPSSVLPRAIGALAVGYYDGGRLIYAGRIGTGYTQALARDSVEAAASAGDRQAAVRSDPERRTPPPRRSLGRAQAGDRIPLPRLDRGRTRAPSRVQGGARRQAAQGSHQGGAGRDRQEGKDIRRSSPGRQGRGQGDESHGKEVGQDREGCRRRQTWPSKPHDKPYGSSASRAKPWKEGDVRFTHPDRVYWVDVGVTKQDLADYYRSVWDWMAPHVVNRPLALVRCPEGTKGQCFFQKHASAGLTEQRLRTVIDSNKRQIIAIEHLDGLLSLVQAGGSMSNTMRSQRSSRSISEPRTWISSTPACTSESSPSRSSIAMIWRFLLSITVRRFFSVSPAEACFWKKHCPWSPSGQRTSASGRSTTCGAISPTPRDSSPPAPAW